jgi:hypothetical protein
MPSTSYRGVNVVEIDDQFPQGRASVRDGRLVRLKLFGAPFQEIDL